MNPQVKVCEVRHLLVHGSVSSVGAEWQGAANAQLGHDEVWTEAAKS